MHGADITGSTTCATYIFKHVRYVKHQTCSYDDDDDTKSKCNMPPLMFEEIPFCFTHVHVPSRVKSRDWNIFLIGGGIPSREYHSQMKTFLNERRIVNTI